MQSKGTIAISGASRGIGLATAEIFAQNGWTVFVAARTAQGLEQMQEKWAKDYPQSQLHTVVADLGTKEGCLHFAHAIGQHTTALNILLNNVGTFVPDTLLDGNIDTLAHFMQVNLFSAHYLTYALKELLFQADQARLMTIGSVAVTDWPAHMATYALSKAALHAWHKGITKELAAHKVATSLIIPGATYTSSWEGIDVDPNDLLKASDVAQLVWDNRWAQETEQEIEIRK